MGSRGSVIPKFKEQAQKGMKERYRKGPDRKIDKGKRRR